MSNYALFYWQAVNSKGQPCEGYRLVRHRYQLSRMLNDDGLVPVRITKKKFCPPGYWRCEQRILIFSQISILLQAGLPLADGLGLLAEGHPQKAWQALLIQLQQQILSGVTFSAALRCWPEIFPLLCISLVYAGEQTGHLEQCCRQLAEQQQREMKLKKN